MKKISISLVIMGLFANLALIESVDSAEDPMLAAGFYRYAEKADAPGFNIEDVEGNQVKLEDFKNKVVLLFFWTTW
jgi:cytochrome oxidase Cu insertion factor (SCO1/SenC/PrrC family)